MTFSRILKKTRNYAKTEGTWYPFPPTKSRTRLRALRRAHGVKFQKTEKVTEAFENEIGGIPKNYQELGCRIYDMMVPPKCAKNIDNRRYARGIKS